VLCALELQVVNESHRYSPFLRPDKIGVAIGFSDPVFRQQFKKKHGKEVEEDMQTAAVEWTQTVFSNNSHGWEDLAFLRKHWPGPIVLKGVLTVDDAKKCVAMGMQGIVVSNHGGREVDGAVSSLSVLPDIVDAVGDKLDVLFDSGIRCGADIAKAMALGAKICLVGRPYIYGLVLGGERGASHVMKALLAELQLTLHLSGITSCHGRDLNRSRMVMQSYL
jgi:isopentenyl diphosphate isomerase/L-lactate dehydrogenase-like FMN-dependent dehydrogenase